MRWSSTIQPVDPGCAASDGGVLGVAGGLVAEAAARRVDDDRAVHDRRPADQRRRRAAARARVALVGVQEGGGGAEPAADPQRVAAGGLAAVVDARRRSPGGAGDQVPVGAVAVGGEQDRPGRDRPRSRRRAYSMTAAATPAVVVRARRRPAGPGRGGRSRPVLVTRRTRWSSSSVPCRPSIGVAAVGGVARVVEVGDELTAAARRRRPATRPAGR